MPWHSEQTCDEYDAERKERMQQEAASVKLIAETAKQCPNPQCGYGITKTSGCDHMTCEFVLSSRWFVLLTVGLGRRCNYEFCYLCLAPWKVILREGNTAHTQNCRYHSDQLDTGEEPDIPDDNSETTEGGDLVIGDRYYHMELYDDGDLL
jgi:hypothetical protein